MSSLATYDWILPSLSKTLQKEALPITRLSISLPAIDTSLPSRESKLSLISAE